jgi:haloacetate dehalogenase
MSDLADLFPGYASEWINTRSGRIFARVGGNGPPLLLLHGFSETHVMWHRVAPQLADKFTLIIADLPGYGWSDMPESDNEHTPYTKRAMAQVIVEAMEQHGHVHFALAGHDRGGRVSYRLALDHPGRLSKLAVLDILPTYEYWERMDRLYALKIYHWTFLAQPFPLPETLIGGNPDFFLRQKMASQTKSKNLSAIDPRALEHYLAAFRDPSRVHAMCEDYRRLCRFRDRQGRSRRGKEDHDPDAGAVGRCRHRARGGDPTRHLEELGNECDGRADRFRPFPDRGKSASDGESAAGVFCRMNGILVPSSSAKRCVSRGRSPHPSSRVPVARSSG